MKIIVATDSFKGSLTAERACGIIAETIAEYLPMAEIIAKPMADGGEGTAKAIIADIGGKWIPREVMGPLPDMQVQAGFAWFAKSKTTLIEMASASGITLLDSKQLNPLKTTTFGTGELIKAAMEMKPEQILLAIGGSATVDVGIGAAIALGWKFLDDKDKPVSLGGKGIERIKKIVPPVSKLLCKVKVLSDVSNPLYGPNGAACVFGPQKGADSEMVKRLDTAIKQLSKLINRQLSIDVSSIPGSGAAGGLGAGAVAFMGAEIVPGIETIMEITSLKNSMQDADWIVTGEGKFDNQSLQGKVVSGIARLACGTNTKVVVIAGNVKLDKSEYNQFGIIDVFCLKKSGMTTLFAMENCEKLLKNATCEFLQKYISSGLKR